MNRLLIACLSFFAVSTVMAQANNVVPPGPPECVLPEPPSDVIVTPPFFGSTSDSVNCRVVNAGEQPADFLIQIVNGAGGIQEEQMFVDVPPSHVRSVTDTMPAISYCRVTGILKRDARVMFCIQNNIGQCLAAVSGE